MQDSGQIALPAVRSGIVPAPAPERGQVRPSSTRSSSPWVLRNWRVRWRLLALVIIPTTTAIVLGGVRIQAARDTAENFAQVNQLTALSSDVTNLANAIEDERDLTAGAIADEQTLGPKAPATVALFGQLNKTYAVTQAKLAVVQQAAGKIGPAFPAVARADLQTAQSRVTALPSLRGLVHSEFLPEPMIADYTGVISSLLAFDDEIAAGNSSAQLSQTVTSLGALVQAEDQASQQRAILYAALLAGGFGTDEFSALQAAQSGQSSEQATFASAASALPAYTPGQGFSASLTEEQQFNNVDAGTGVDDAQAIEQDAVIGGGATQGLTASLTETTGSDQAATQAQAWFSDTSQDLTDIRAVEADELDSISAQANAAARGAQGSERLTAAVVLVLLLLVLLVTIVMARSMIIPLRRLRTDALDVAGRRLPAMVTQLSHSQPGETVTIEPIGIDSSDEIGEVARAFDRVHNEAVRLAAEEALLRANLNAMFVNLSRRSQSLIERQLGIIETLEQSEQDSDRLSSLFRLDHLATRMRRNSENLLVLAGHEAPRKWTKPVPLVDVLRAAVSEIEQYERIVLNVQSGLLIAGRAASDVVHLAAELAENSTTFSRADTRVMVSGQQLPSGGVLIEISDQGLGIPEQELAHANWRLDNPPVIDVSVSRRMGLFVVGRLAARHGIRVRLRSANSDNGGSGLSALIWVPDTISETEPADAQRDDARWRTATGGFPVVDGTSTVSVGTVAAGTAATGAAPVGTGPGGRVGVPAPARSSTWFGGKRNGAAAPDVPTQPAPVQSGAGQDAPSTGAEGTPAQRLPIFDAVESDWFRRGLPDGPAGNGATNSTAMAAKWASSPVAEGFRRAAATVDAPATEPVTNAGLPKRRAGANLVPGSIASGGSGAGQSTSQSQSLGGGARPATPAPPATLTRRSRSPEEVRARMAGFQNRGRGSRPDNQRTGSEQSGHANGR